MDSYQNIYVSFVMIRIFNINIEVKSDKKNYVKFVMMRICNINFRLFVIFFFK